MNSKYKGMVVEAQVMTDLMACGCAVLTPFGDSERYDLIVDINGTFYRIQCKSSRTRDNGKSFEFDCRSNVYKYGQPGFKHRPYTKDEIDYFATSFRGQSYMVPVGVSDTVYTLRLVPTKNRQKKRVNWARDYELEKIVDALKAAKESEEDDGETNSI